MFRETIFNNGDDFFKSLIESILKAKDFIHIETYIFEQDSFGSAVLIQLAAAASRGVRVQLLLDGVGSVSWTYASAEIWRQQGVEIKFFHALPWQKHPSAIWKLLTLKKIALGFFKLNRRNHRKVCLVDDQVVFISSMNISDRHLPSIYGQSAWHDIAVKTEGVSNESYCIEARDTWNFSQQHHGRRWHKISRQKKNHYDQLLQQVRQSKTRIWITNPYFVPDLRLTRALCRSAQSGVDIKILLPSRSDIFGLKFATESFYNALLSCRVEIYEYCSAILHAKILVVDDSVSVGSFNLDFRSIFYNLETSAKLSRIENIQLIERQFLDDIKISNKIELSLWKKRSWFHQQLEKFFLLFQGLL